MATLYRKYRSNTFDEIIGQEPIVTTLTNQIKLGRIGHAYLFTGSRGTGKTSCARIFARAVNCEHPVNGSPCGECETCKKLASPDAVDIIEMDAASNNGVDDARDIREKVKYLPVSCKYKVYIIDEVHMLTGGAFNALLKTIEEPPEHVIFILATTEPQKLPQTILSRCIRFDFKLVPAQIIAAHISRIYDKEGVKYTPEAVDEIARLGEGSVRDALSVADTLMSAAEVITPEVVLSLTGAGDSESVSRLFDCVVSRDLAGALVEVDNLAKNGRSMPSLARRLTDYARGALVVKSVGSKASTILNVDKDTFERMTVSAEKFAIADLSRTLENFSSAESGMKYSVNPRVFLETALVKTVSGAFGEDELRKRVAALEKRLNSANLAEQKKNEHITPVVTTRTESYIPEPPPDYAPPIEERSAVDPVGADARRKDPAPTVTVKPIPKKIESESGTGVKTADEGEFMHLKAVGINGLELLGKFSSYLRKKGTYAAARARELLSRGAAVKERDDAIAVVVPDENYLSVTEQSVVAELNGVLDSLGIKKRIRVEKTAEDLYVDDLIKARELFGRDNVVARVRS